MGKIDWVKPNGSVVTTNDEKHNIEKAEELNWTMVSKSSVKRKPRHKKAEKIHGNS